MSAACVLLLPSGCGRLRAHLLDLSGHGLLRPFLAIDVDERRGSPRSS